MFADQLKVLDMKKDLAASDVDVALTELTKLEQSRQKDAEGASETLGAAVDAGAPTSSPRGSVSTARPVARPVAPTPSPDLEVAQSLSEIRAKVKDLEEQQKRRIAEADSQLADARAGLGPLHPTVVALTRKAEAARESLPELASLRAQEKQLVQRLAESATTAASAAPAPAQSPTPTGGSASSPSPSVSTDLRMATDLHAILTNHEDAPTTLARAKLTAASQQYNDLLGRTQASKVELDVARSSFKEEYSVVRPPEVPTKPQKPNAVLIVFGGLVGALALFFLVPCIRDLLGGVLIEPWQVETRLKLQVLGELSSESVGALGRHGDEVRRL
jgi:DNA repair exonuclease SbcCD ATPase subunit